MLFRSKGKPALTRQAEKLSSLLLSLDAEGRQRAAATIKGIVVGVKNMSALPDEITTTLMDILMTIGRRVALGNGETVGAELENGIDQRVKALIWENLE